VTLEPVIAAGPVALGEGVPLVLLHPLGVDHGFWSPVLPALGTGPVVLVDLPGHGHSPRPDRPYGVADVAVALTRVLRAAGHTREHVVGASLGGLVAQALAAADPSLVDHLVLVDTVAVYPEAQRVVWRDRAQRVAAPTDALPDPLPEIADQTVRAWFDDTASAAAAATRTALLGVDRLGYALTCTALAGADVRGTTAGIRHPTLVVCGRGDAPAFTDAASWLHAVVPGSRLGWLPGRHAAPVEHPALFAEQLGAFLS